VQVELVNTGSELMLGRVLNTHQQWLCRQLADRGRVVTRQVAIADQSDAIVGALREALGRSDLVIATGGLGPTSDDLTRDLVAAMLGRTLREDPAIVEEIRGFFTGRGRVMPERARRQAQVPDGALVLKNAHGTAPGLAIEANPNPFRAAGGASWLIMLPGPPRELRPMFLDQVVPLLDRVLPVGEPFVCRTYRTTGLPESTVEEMVDAPLRECVAAGLELGYCARPGQVDVRLAAHGADAATLVEAAARVVCERLGAAIYGLDDEDLETVLVRELAARGATLAVAESCTGGWLAHRITMVPGASAVFKGGFVTYSNEAKVKWLGVALETLEAHGAVSEPVAREMAAGVRAAAGADYGISLTGIAGPGGGSPDKPVGTVFIGVAGPGGITVTRHCHPFDRETFKNVAAQQALDRLRRILPPR